MKRDFKSERPNEKWLTDITEFGLPDGKVYLSPVIDCFDGLPVAWTIGTSPNAALVNSMLDQAIATLKDGEKPIVHSDRGRHYRWPGWIDRMEYTGLTRSMPEKGCSPDNAACEGFFGHLKNEMFYNRSWQGVSTKEFIAILNEYLNIHNIHNNKCIICFFIILIRFPCAFLLKIFVNVLLLTCIHWFIS